MASGMNRRDFIRLIGAGAASVSLGMNPRRGRANPMPGDVFWINVQATGGWDPALFSDPRPTLRTGLNRTLYLYGVPTLTNGMPSMGTGLITPATSTQIRTTPNNGIRYLGFADFHGDPANPNHPYKCFFPTYYDRLTIINGIDTGTVNHDIGTRYCASGSDNAGSPCFSTQVAYVRGADRPLSFLNLGGYAETAGLLAATPLQGGAIPNLLRVVNPDDQSGDNMGVDALLDPGSLDSVLKAHAARTGRLHDKLLLPEQRRGIQALQLAESGQSNLRALHFAGNDTSQKNVISIGVDAFRQGLAWSMNVNVGGFDTHGDNEQGQAAALYNLFEIVKLILKETENPSNGKQPVAAVIAVTSDFGRSPYYRNQGTDHWPVTSLMVVQNSLAKSMNLPIPTNTVIGATTGGDQLVALRATKLDPVRLVPDPNGVLVTPGHFVRALRRLSKIDGSPKLALFPLTVDKDLAIG